MSEILDALWELESLKFIYKNMFLSNTEAIDTGIWIAHHQCQLAFR